MLALSYQDIIDEVVAAVSDFPEPSTLTACALVSAQWRRSARRFVLRRIKLSSEARLDELTDLLERDLSTRAFIHTLVIIETPLTSSPWVSTVPYTLAPKLPQLRALHFIDLCDTIDVFGRHFVEGLSMFATVESLSIIRNIVDYPRIAAMAAALPNLRHLRLDLIQPLSFDYPIPPKIHELRLLSLGIEAERIETFAAAEFLKWIGSTPSAQSLRSLRLGINFSDAEETGRFLVNVGPRLKELELSLEMVAPPVFESEIIREDISLSRCTTLQALTLRHPRGPVCRVLLELLGEVPSPDIRKLTLGVLSIDDPRLHNGVDPPDQLPNFSPLLSRLPRSVEELTILYGGTLQEQEVLRQLRHDLHPITTQCILFVRRV